MKVPAAQARSAAWIIVGVAVPLVAIAAFLRDQFPVDWPDWAIAGTIVAGMAGAILAFRRDSMGRALLWLVSLAVVTLLLVYDALDAIIDPFVEADWPVAVVAIVLVVGLGSLLGILISDNE